jgi:hypothetical protein
MLPDFRKVKSRANRDLLRWVRQQVPAVTPLIQGVARFAQHEGSIGRMVRTDDSEETIDYRPSAFKFGLERDEMRRFNLPAIQEKLIGLAKEIGKDQEKRMLETVSEAAESVGNVVNAGGDLTADKFLEMFRRVQMDFDAKTLQPKPGFVGSCTLTQPPQWFRRRKNGRRIPRTWPSMSES